MLQQLRQRRRMFATLVLLRMAIMSIMLLRHLNNFTISGFKFIINTRPRGSWYLLRNAVVGSSKVKFSSPTITFATTKQTKRTRLTSISSSSSDNNHLDDETTTKQHVVTWKTSKRGNITFTAHDGELLRTAALRSNIISPHNDNANYINCRGLGTCGTCAIQIVDDDDQDEIEGKKDPNIIPVSPNAIERFRLSVPPGHGNGTSQEHLRLACQIQVKGDVTIQKWEGFWGQYYNTTLSDGSLPTKPLGQLEYILDTKSPKTQSPSSSSETKS